MFVEKWMSKPAVTISDSDSMHDAGKMMRQKRIRMLPVMKKGKLVGIVTDRDLKRASASDATSLEIHELLYLLDTVKVKEIMTKSVITVQVDHTLGETAELLLEKKISGVPVLDHRSELAGVITQSDLFKAFIALTGIKKRGVELGFELEDRPGSIKEVTDIIREYGGRLAGILSSYDDVQEGFRNVYIRFFDMDADNVQTLIRQDDIRRRLMFIVDHRTNLRKAFR